MWNHFKIAAKKAATRRRAQRELDYLLSQSDHIRRDIGLDRADILRVKRATKYL